MHFLIRETLSFNLIYVAACYLVGTGMCHNMVGLLQHYKGEVGALLNLFKPSGKIFLMIVPGRCFFCRSFMLFLSCFVVLSCTSVC